VQWTTVGNLI